jgi:hypothetical protein
VNSPSKRNSAQARNMLKKRGAYPKSGARIVGQFVLRKTLILITSRIIENLNLVRVQIDSINKSKPAIRVFRPIELCRYCL